MANTGTLVRVTLGVGWGALARRGAPDKCTLRPHEHCFCSVGRMQPEDLQQPGVCRPPGSICQPGLRGRVPADPDVHHPHELRQGLGSRVQVGAGALVPGMRGLQVAQNAEQGLPRDELGWPLPRRAEGPGIRAGPSPTRREEPSSARPVSQELGAFHPHHNPGWGRWHCPRCTDEGTKAQGGKATSLKLHHLWKS